MNKLIQSSRSVPIQGPEGASARSLFPLGPRPPPQLPLLALEQDNVHWQDFLGFECTKHSEGVVLRNPPRAETFFVWTEGSHEDWRRAMRRRNHLVGIAIIAVLSVGAAGVRLVRTVPQAKPAGPLRPQIKPTGVLPAASKPRLVEAYGKLPLSFEANQGQTAGQVKFLLRGRGYTLFLTADEAVLALRNPSAPAKGHVFSRAATPLLPSPFAWALAPEEMLAGITDNGPRTADALFAPLFQNPKSQIEDRLSRAPSPESQAPSVLRLRLMGANPNARATGLDPLPGKSNYFIGNDPKKWRTNVPQYAKVKYKDIYPGIDLVYYGNQGRMEHDFIVAPGADPRAISLSIDGAQGIEIQANGDLLLRSAGGDVRLEKPVVYQRTTDMGRLTTANRQSSIGNRQFLNGRYTITAKNQVAFEVAPYDRTRPLLIDPVLSYSTFLGGSLTDGGLSIAVDTSGNAYVFGGTRSPDFPTTAALFQTNSGGVDAFVTKLNPAGSALVYSTYLGGSADEQTFGGSGIAVNASGEVYVTGNTFSTDFPTTPGAFQRTPSNPCVICIGGCVHPFITSLNAEGSALKYSTYLSGCGLEWSNAIAIDADGNAYVAGGTESPDFPTTPGALDSALCTVEFPEDAFITKVNPVGSALVYSTLLGGCATDRAEGIAVDISGNAYVAGTTLSADFPTSTGALQPAMRGHQSAFVAKLDALGSALVYATYLGGSTSTLAGYEGVDWGGPIVVDSSGSAYVAGTTASTDFPTTPGALQTALAGNIDVFLTKVNPDGSNLDYSTYLGGSGSESEQGIYLDRGGDVYLTGITTSTNFPTTPDAFQAHLRGTQNVYIAKVNPEGTELLYSSYLGGSGDDGGYGIAVDPSGNAYVTGQTTSTDFPTTTGAFQTISGGGVNDGFVAKISPTPRPVATLSSASLAFANQVVNTASPPQAVTLSNTGNAALSVAEVGTSGDFAQSNDCGTLVAAGGACAINVTFNPTAAGLRTGALTINDNAPGSPHTVALSGTGTDFALAAASGGSTSATVNAGQTATYNLQVAPTGFSGNVALSCAWTLSQPRGTNCTVSPTSVNVDGTNAAPFTATVTTTARSLAGPRPDSWPPARIGPRAVPLVVWLLGLMILMTLAARRRRRVYAGLAVSMLFVLLWAACGGGGGAGAPPPSPQTGTPAGTYTLTITGAAGGVTRTATLTLKVN